MKSITLLAKLFLLASAVCLLSIAAGCVTDAPVHPHPAAPDLPGTEWQLKTIYDAEGSRVPVLQGTSITLLFDEESLGGNAGCNLYFGSYTLKNGEISVSGIGSTLMYCTDPPGVMDQEQMYLNTLGEVAAVYLDGDRLIFLDADTDYRLVFLPLIVSEEPALIGTTWILQSITEDGVDHPVLPDRAVTAVFDGERIWGSGGCNSYTAGYTSDNQSIIIDPPASTKVYCHEPKGLMDQENRFFSLLTKVERVTIEEGRLTLSSAENDNVLIFSSKTPPIFDEYSG